MEIEYPHFYKIHLLVIIFDAHFKSNIEPQTCRVNFGRSFFCTKIPRANFLHLHFKFVLVWRKNFNTKVAQKMFAKLTPNKTSF